MSNGPAKHTSSTDETGVDQITDSASSELAGTDESRDEASDPRGSGSATAADADEELPRD